MQTFHQLFCTIHINNTNVIFMGKKETLKGCLNPYHDENT